MTVNDTLSIPNALKREHPKDYYENTATIEWPLGPDGAGLSDPRLLPCRRGLQGRWPHHHRQGLRPFSRGRGLARALSRLRGRAHAAADAEAARGAVLARYERSAPHGRGDAGRLAAHAIQLRHGLGRLAPQASFGQEHVWSKGRPPRRRRGHHPRAGGRRGDRPDQADPGGVTATQRLVTALVASALLLAPPAARRPTSSSGGTRVLPAGKRGGRGHRRRLPAEKRQAGRAGPNGRRHDSSGGGPGAIDAGRPPDFLFGHVASTSRSPAGLTRAAWWTSPQAIRPVQRPVRRRIPRTSTLLNGKTGRTGLYALPMARTSTHVHVWRACSSRRA